MKNENEILRELLHCYQSIVSIDQRTEKMKTLEWVLGENIQERLLPYPLCSLPFQSEPFFLPNRQEDRGSRYW